MTDGPVETVKLWDPLLRGFHWLLAALVITTWGLGKFGPANMWLHFWLGYAIIGLLAFRILWGFVGPRPARFASFVRGPGAIVAYLRTMFHRRPSYWPGHNPLGALSVLALIGVLGMQAASGLIADPDDYINVGPLASQVSRDLSRKAVGWHDLGAGVILLLVAIHIAVIVFYRVWKREDLVRPMLTGWKKIVRR